MSASRVLLAGVLVSLLACSAPPADDPAPAAEQAVMIYLHGAIIESQGERPTHPEHGVYEYRRILDRFRDEGLGVISAVRPADADVATWAEHTASQVRGLIGEGVRPELITVVGFSKGGTIALRTATLIEEPAVGFVIIAACGDWIPASWVPRGPILSLREASDSPRLGSCQSIFDRTADPEQHRELVLELGGGHGAFYRPRDEWVAPVTEFARRGLR